MVYVLDRQGKALMPTERFAHVRKLLRTGRAIVVSREPFTIKLTYDSTCFSQPVSLGIDAGSKYIGVSATTEKKELYAAQVQLRSDITKLLATRREARRTRRNHLRYRKPRFDNRKRVQNSFAPTIENRICTHLSVIRRVYAILPITKLTIEVAPFDMQKIANPDIEGTGYQQGEQLGFWNTREYVLSRDNHTCQHCKGKSGDKVLNVHHIESRLTGGNAPSNLITLCETCHKAFHRGEFELKVKRSTTLRDAASLNIMRWELFNRAKQLWTNVHLTYGYITKHTRITCGLEKSHAVDARCISGNPLARPLDYLYEQKQVREHNRQIHKSNRLKGGKLKLNQAPYRVFGFRLFDKVKVGEQVGFVYGRRSSGFFDIRTIDGEKITSSISYKKLRFLQPKLSILTIRKRANHALLPPPQG